MSDSRPAFGQTDLLLLLMAVIWGVNYSAAKYASLLFTPMLFVWLRIMLALATLTIVAIIRRKPWPPWRDMRALLGLGIIGNGMYQCLFLNGLARTRVADAALIVAAAPACMAILSRLRGVDRIRRRSVLGIIISVTGVGIVIMGSTHMTQRQGSTLGLVLMVSAVLCWSVFSVLLRPYTLRVDPVHMNMLAMLGGALPLMCLTPVMLAHVSWRTVPLLGWGAAMYSSAISIGVAYLFWFRGVRVLGPTRASMYGNLQPVVAILVAWAVLRETPTFWQAGGTAAIIGGLLLTRT